jgi:hypothetical protein
VGSPGGCATKRCPAALALTILHPEAQLPLLLLVEPAKPRSSFHLSHNLPSTLPRHHQLSPTLTAPIYTASKAIAALASLCRTLSNTIRIYQNTDLWRARRHTPYTTLHTRDTRDTYPPPTRSPPTAGLSIEPTHHRGCTVIFRTQNTLSAEGFVITLPGLPPLLDLSRRSNAATHNQTKPSDLDNPTSLLH